MKDLTIRLDALDPQAGAALRVISYFDDLLSHNAGVQAIVRGAAVLGATAATLVDNDRGVRVRIDRAGRSGSPADRSPDPAWPSAPVGPGNAVLWLERSGPKHPVDDMIVERAASAATTVLERTYGRGSSRGREAASLEVLLDPAAPASARATAARRLGLDKYARVRAVALPGGAARVLPASGTPPTGSGQAIPEGTRAGIGPAVPVTELPVSWETARLALRLTARGTPADPGPRIVHADDSGGLLVLARTVGPDTPKIADVEAIETAGRAAPWMLLTLDTIAATSSLRAAATALHVHHSTLQERVVQAEHLLGWPLGDPAGRFRLHLALALRRLHRAQPDPTDDDRIVPGGYRPPA
ncbi:PucR family transcriptional regulator [Amycolatopsis rhizosphaerae]|uniref:PucR family transcriptional regulator n=1 Tax=Amycolatopsis rhizosphaerae TaxID=2053003 RepID=A0A558DIT1_9PSEU|nr:helix-turn-helix domain-containing protein [Amycolatopsis rhizosphaerae]TVT60929.1 PucR family transcriptional regulator [Amycolatopsis rhizosphaerae]